MPTTTLNRWGIVVWEIYSARTIPLQLLSQRLVLKLLLAKTMEDYTNRSLGCDASPMTTTFPILRQVSNRGKSETLGIFYENANNDRIPWCKVIGHLAEIARFVPTILNCNARMDHDEIVLCRMLNWVRHEMSSRPNPTIYD